MPIKRRGSFRTLGMRMQDFGRSLMRHYAPPESAPIGRNIVPPPSWQADAETPLVWNEPQDGLPPLVDSLPFDASMSEAPPAAAQPASPPPVRQARPAAPAAQRKAADTENKIDPRLLAILGAHQEREAQAAKVREERHAAAAASELQRQIDESQPGAQPTRRRNRASFDYVETKALMPPEEEPGFKPLPKTPAETIQTERQPDQPKDDDDSEESRAGAFFNPEAEFSPMTAAEDELSETTVVSSSSSSTEQPSIQRASAAEAFPAADEQTPSDDDYPPSDESSSAYTDPNLPAATTSEAVQRSPEIARRSPSRPQNIARKREPSANDGTVQPTIQREPDMSQAESPAAEDSYAAGFAPAADDNTNFDEGGYWQAPEQPADDSDQTDFAPVTDDNENRYEANFAPPDVGEAADEGGNWQTAETSSAEPSRPMVQREIEPPSAQRPARRQRPVEPPLDSSSAESEAQDSLTPQMPGERPTIQRQTDFDQTVSDDYQPSDPEQPLMWWQTEAPPGEMTYWADDDADTVPMQPISQPPDVPPTRANRPAAEGTTVQRQTEDSEFSESDQPTAEGGMIQRQTEDADFAAYDEAAPSESYAAAEPPMIQRQAEDSDFPAYDEAAPSEGYQPSEEEWQGQPADTFADEAAPTGFETVQREIEPSADAPTNEAAPSRPRRSKANKPAEQAPDTFTDEAAPTGFETVQRQVEATDFNGYTADEPSPEEVEFGYSESPASTFETDDSLDDASSQADIGNSMPDAVQRQMDAPAHELTYWGDDEADTLLFDTLPPQAETTEFSAPPQASSGSPLVQRQAEIPPAEDAFQTEAPYDAFGDENASPDVEADFPSDIDVNTSASPARPLAQRDFVQRDYDEAVEQGEAEAGEVTDDYTASEPYEALPFPPIESTTNRPIQRMPDSSVEFSAPSQESGEPGAFYDAAAEQAEADVEQPDVFQALIAAGMVAAPPESRTTPGQANTIQRQAAAPETEAESDYPNPFDSQQSFDAEPEAGQPAEPRLNVFEALVEAGMVAPPAGSRPKSPEIARKIEPSPEPPASSSRFPDHIPVQYANTPPVVMRAETGEATSSAPPQDSESHADVDVDKLARDVYSALRQRLRIDKERRG